MACVMGDMDLVRPLGLAGIRCAVVAEPGSASTYSRFAQEVLTIDGDAGTPQMLDMLLAFAARQRCPPILFFEQDAELLMVARNASRLAAAFRFTLAEPRLVEDLVDKGRFQALALRHGLPVPLTRHLRTDAAAPPELGLRYPIVVKPVVRGKLWGEAGGKGKALRFESPAALAAAWPSLAMAGSEVLAQEMVPGPESRIESYHVYVDAGGAVAAEFTGRKIRTFPVQMGHSTALEITDEWDVAEIGREVVSRIGLRGVAKLDFKRDPEGRLFLLEINPRFNLWHHLGAVAGINIPAIVYADLAGLPRPARAAARPGARWCSLSKDLQSAREAGVPLRSWIPWALRCDAKSVAAWDDPMPYIAPRLRRHTAQWAAGKGNAAP